MAAPPVKWRRGADRHGWIMEVGIDTQRQTTWSYWSVPLVAALCLTYLGLWLLTNGLVHAPQNEELPLNVVLETPLQQATQVVPPRPVIKGPPPDAPRKLLTQEPAPTPTQADIPAPPLEAPRIAQLELDPPRDSPPVEIATESVAQPPRIETVPMSRLTRTPAFVQKVDPEDPKSAQIPLDGVRVIVRITLDETAAVRDVEIIKSGGAAFDAAAIVAVRRSRFTPGYIDDRPVAVAFDQPYRFRLR